MDKLKVMLGAVVLAIGGIVLLAFLMAFPVKWAWNATMPRLFNLAEIGALQAWCLMFLGSSFFKSTTNLKCKHDE